MNDYNRLAKPDKQDILEKLSVLVTFNRYYQPFDDDHSAEKL